MIQYASGRHPEETVVSPRQDSGPMFTAALLVTARAQRQPTWPLTDGRLGKESPRDTVEYRSDIKKKEVLPFGPHGQALRASR